MQQQDYTAPEVPVKISRREAFQHVFEVFGVDGQPDSSIANQVYSVDIRNLSGTRITTLPMSRPAPHAVGLEVSQAQMNKLTPGRYRFEVKTAVEGLVTIVATVVDEIGAGSLTPVGLFRQLQQPTQVHLNRGIVNLFAAGSFASYCHTQTSAATIWYVHHNMNGYPAGILVKDSAGEQWMPAAITYTDQNSLTLSFGDAAFSGKAYIS